MDTKQILAQLHNEQKRIEQAIAAIERLSSNSRGTWTGKAQHIKTTSVRRGGRRRMSAAGRKRLSELLKKRWATGKMGKKKAKAA